MCTVSTRLAQYLGKLTALMAIYEAVWIKTKLLILLLRAWVIVQPSTLILISSARSFLVSNPVGTRDLIYGSGPWKIFPPQRKKHEENEFFFFRFLNVFAICIDTFKYNQQIVCLEAMVGRGVLCSTSPW
jgi:hypothetical protein